MNNLTDILKDVPYILGAGAFVYCAYRLSKKHIIPGAEKLDEEIKEDVDKQDYKFDSNDSPSNYK